MRAAGIWMAQDSGLVALVPWELGPTQDLASAVAEAQGLGGDVRATDL
jgi:hypothetical protein